MYDEIDPHSATWRLVKRRAEKLLQQSRTRLENPGLDPVSTEYERGRIRSALDILALAEPEAPVPEIEAPASVYD